MDEKYLLTTPMAQRLYFETAKQLPLIDYHNHLSAADIAADRHFGDVAEIWLLGDRTSTGRCAYAACLRSL